MASLENLIANNRRWATGLAQAEPDFFQRLVQQQSPRYLWIGCADSRVPANQIVGLLPGELFVHRNVANLVVHTDLNCLSVLQYAIDVLHVEHVIVCGHYGCGGIAAADRGVPLGLIDNWLRHIQDVAERYQPALARESEEKRRLDRLSEFNVLEQALNVCRTTTVQDAWHRGQSLEVHAWIYRLTDGLVQDLGFCASRDAEPVAELAKALTVLDVHRLLSADHPLKLLLARGLQQGHLTVAQIGEHLPATLADSRLLKEIVKILGYDGVLVEGDAPPAQDGGKATAVPHAQPQGDAQQPLSSAARAGPDAGLESPPTQPTLERSDEPGKPT